MVERTKVVTKGVIRPSNVVASHTPLSPSAHGPGATVDGGAYRAAFSDKSRRRTAIMRLACAGTRKIGVPYSLDPGVEACMEHRTGAGVEEKEESS
jgi:hypothetical protein